MSFKLGMNTVQDALTIVLMVVLVFAVLYSDMELSYKIGIGVLGFSIIFVASIAGQMLKQMKEKEKEKRF
jgi:general stress protein CsbA